MMHVRLGTNFAVFILFFGVALLEAFQTEDWFRVAFWLAIGLVFFLGRSAKKLVLGRQDGFRAAPPRAVCGRCVNMHTAEHRAARFARGMEHQRRGRLGEFPRRRTYGMILGCEGGNERAENAPSRVRVLRPVSEMLARASGNATEFRNCLHLWAYSGKGS